MPGTTITVNPPKLSTRTRLRRRRREEPDLADAIDVLIVDNDPAMRFSLQGALSIEPGIGKVDTALSPRIAIKRAIARRPHVCLVNYRLAVDAGLLVTHHLKRLERPPSVIVYAAALDFTVAGAARIAGADGLIVSPPWAYELGQIVRRVANGERQLPAITPSALRDLAARLEPADRPIATMLVRDTPPSEVATVLGLSREQLSARQWAILDQLRRPLVEPSTNERTAEQHSSPTAPMPRFAS
jgi:DNA-binding NarL/FixJ family response regulator